MKKLKGEVTRQLSDIQPYVANTQARSTEDEGKDEVDGTEQGAEQGTAGECHASEAPDEEEDDEEDADEGREDEKPVMVAVSRGRPLPDLKSMPSLTMQAMKQRFSTGKPSTTRAMIRGRVTDFNDGQSIWRWSETEGWAATKKKRSRESHKDVSQVSKKVKAERKD